MSIRSSSLKTAKSTHRTNCLDHNHLNNNFEPHRYVSSKKTRQCVSIRELPRCTEPIAWDKENGEWQIKNGKCSVIADRFLIKSIWISIKKNDGKNNIFAYLIFIEWKYTFILCINYVSPTSNLSLNKPLAKIFLKIFPFKRLS